MTRLRAGEDLFGLYMYVRHDKIDEFTTKVYKLMLRSAENMRVATALLQLVLDIGGNTPVSFEEAWDKLEAAELYPTQKREVMNLVLDYSTNGEEFYNFVYSEKEKQFG